MTILDTDGNAVHGFPETPATHPLTVEERLERLEIGLNNHINNNEVHWSERLTDKLHSVYIRVFGE